MTILTKTLYDTDFNLWIEQTVNALKSGNLQNLDLENLIEEIESMGKRDKRGLYNRLKVLLMHLIKYQYQPEKKTNSWIETINEQRSRIKRILKDSPSLKPYLSEIWDECYQDARTDAALETFLNIETFPLDCPFTEEDVLKTGFFPKLETNRQNH